MERNTGLIFDLDGTLWDAVEEITASWNIAAARWGRKEIIQKEQMQSLMGKTMDQFTQLFPELAKSEAEELLDLCCQVEEEYLEQHPGKVYPGVREMLDQLHRLYPLYIVSNCQGGYIETFLKGCGLEEFFTDSLDYGRTGRGKGDNISQLMRQEKLTKGIYLGDTIGDAMACKEAGVIFIHAAYGFGQVPEAKYRIEKPNQLPVLIRQLEEGIN